MGDLKAFVNACIAAAMGLTAVFGVSAAQGQSILDPTPVAKQQALNPAPATAVDSLNFEASILGGAFQRNALGTASNFMAVGSIASPIPVFTNFGIQGDAAIGVYDGDFTSAAGGLHIFWRDPSLGALGIYGDWAYVNPEHAGRVGGELAFYNDRWSLDAFFGFQFGQNVFTEFVDEVDLSYYFTDNFRGSIGHRYTSRGNVGNISFEALLPDSGMEGLSIFGEFEAGEDNYVAGFGGIRYAFGSPTTTLIERDRQASVPVRIPRNIASVTQCGSIDNPIPATSLRTELSDLCASEDAILSRSSSGIEKF